MAKKCCMCGDEAGFLRGISFQEIKRNDYCSSCATEYVTKAISAIIITTTNHLDGYVVKRYIDIESVEIVAGTGMFSEFGGDVADFFGARSTAFEQKLQKAKRTALDKLKYAAFERGGNAVIAIDLDYTEFSGNRIGLIANGTIVEVESI
ncbi:heavy metal-binding domain-containing protein [Geomonas terrae]|uniref:Heavy metal-binding domain-containing protein n=1 Tax=Geomonas terrae TaxID=2562681 RepID=A0A4S1CEG9_9BACT|nr:heavy metal-binding domain-containing protein [Geomonas terrae]TGU71420.1 heavy metal-binding domain-containing protein [Geomonas terrae]